MLLKVRADPQNRTEVRALLFLGAACIFCSCLLGLGRVDFDSVCLLICFFCLDTQIKWLVDTFRGKIVDISEDSVTIEVIAGHIWMCFSR
jgi:acetolactate synthase small subunit